MKLRILLLASTAFALAACSSDDPEPLTVPGPLANPPQSLVVQAIHAVPDAPVVNINIGSSSANGLDFKDTVGSIAIEPATLNVSVDAVDADATIADVIGPVSYPFAADTITTIIAVGSTATIQPVIVEQPLAPVTAGNARLVLVHGAEGAGTVDVFASASGVAPVDADLLVSFDFLGETPPTEVPAGDYLITVTDGGAGGTVLYNAEITLADGLSAVLVATPTTAGGTTAPISLVGHASSNGATLEFRDDDDPAFVRVGHLSPDAPAVDIIADAAVLISNLAFPDVTAITELAPATYEIEVSPTGAYPGTVVIPDDGTVIDLALAAGTTTNVFAVGPLASIEAITATDDTRSVSTYAKIRLIHASPTAGDVDVYFVAPGTTDLSAETPVGEEVAFKDNSGFGPLDNVADPGTPDYDVFITATGSTTPAIGPIALEYADGDVITIIARDEVGGGAVSADVVVLTD